jgi:hypothetical protein
MDNNIRSTAHRRGGYALVLAGALIVLGHALSVDIGNSGHRYVSAFAADRGLHVSGGLITATAALLLSVGLATAAKAFAEQGNAFARAAASVASLGAAGLAMGLAMVTMVMGALIGRDTHLAVRAYDTLNHAALASLPFLLAYLFTLGVLAMAVSLVIAGGRQRLIGVVLLVGTVIDFASPSGGVTTAALHIPQAIAFALLGLSLVDHGKHPSKLASGAVASVEPAAQPLPAA